MGGVPPPRGRVQVPIATQDVRLGPRHVEALGRLDWEWHSQQSPECRGSGSGTHELRGRGGTPPRSPRLRRSSASAVQSGDSQGALSCPQGTWTAEKGWLCGGRGPGSSPSQRVWESPSFSTGTPFSPDSLGQALLGHKKVEETARGAAPAPEPFVCCPVGPEAQRWQNPVWAQRAGAG